MGQILGNLTYNDKVLKPIGRPVDDLKALYQDKGADYNYVIDNLNKTETALNEVPYIPKDEPLVVAAKDLFNTTHSQFAEDGDFENKIVDTKNLANTLTNRMGLMRVQSNAKARSEYIGSLQKLVDEGKLSVEGMNKRLAYSDKSYSGVQKNELTGTYTGSYIGRPAAPTIDVGAHVLEQIKGIQSSKVPFKNSKGEYELLVKDPNGSGYYTASTREAVTEEQVRRFATTLVEGNELIQGQYNEEIALELGLRDNELTTTDLRDALRGPVTDKILNLFEITDNTLPTEDAIKAALEKQGISEQQAYAILRKEQMLETDVMPAIAKETFEKIESKYLVDWKEKLATENGYVQAKIDKEAALITINKIGTTQRISPMDMTNIKTGIESTKANLLLNTANLNNLRDKLAKGDTTYSPQETKELERAINEDNRVLENLQRQEQNITDFVRTKSNMDIDFHYNNYITSINDEKQKKTQEYTEALLNEKETIKDFGDHTGKLTYRTVPKYSVGEASKLAAEKANKEFTTKDKGTFHKEVISKYTLGQGSASIAGRTSDFNNATAKVANLIKEEIGDLKDLDYTTDAYTFIVGDSNKQSHAMWRDYEGNMNKAFLQSPENFVAGKQDFTTLVDTELGVDYENVDLAKTKVYPVIETIDGKPGYAIEVFEYVDDNKTKSVSKGKILTNYEGNAYGQEEVVKKVTALEAAKYNTRLQNGNLTGHDLTIFRKLAQVYISADPAGKALDELNLYSAKPNEALSWEIAPGTSIDIIPKKDIRKESNGVEIDDLTYELRDKQGRVYGKDANGNDTWGYANELKDIHMFDNPLEIKEVVGSSLLKAAMKGDLEARTITGGSIGASIPASVWQQPGTTININNIIQQESGGNANAVSNKGATGLMQITPTALRDYNGSVGLQNGKPYTMADMTNPDINKKIGTWYMTTRIPAMLSSYSIPDTAAHRAMAYNWGIGELVNWYQNGADVNAIPEETANYLNNVISTQ